MAIRNYLKVLTSILSVLFYSCSENSDVLSSDNHPPVIHSVTANPRIINTNSSTILTCEATDSDSDSLSYLWSCQYGTISNILSPTTSWLPPDSSGLYTCRITVSDGKDIEVESVSIEVAIPVPDSIIAKANQYIISRVGELFFSSYITFDSSKSRYYPADEFCIQNPSSCAEYLQFPHYLMVYTFRIPELSFVDEIIEFAVDTLGNVIEEREPGGIPNCANNNCWENFHVIDESEAITIAQNAGLEAGIGEWTTSFHYFYGDIDDYVWTVQNTTYQSSEGGGGEGVVINAYSGEVIMLYNWAWIP